MDFISYGSKRMLSCYRVFALAVFQPAIFLWSFQTFQGYGFRVVYRGMENSCVIDKLQRNTCYKFRVSIGRKKRIHCGGKLIRKLLWKVNWSIWHERGTKKIWVPERNPPMTFRTPGSRSIYWGTRTYGEQCHFGVWEAMVGFNSCRGLRFCLCPTLVSYWLIHLSHFITELKIHHL